MADQIADNGSPERVALDLTRAVWNWSNEERAKFLDLYAECLRATTRARKLPTS